MDPDVILALKSMHRRIGRAQNQAYPLTREVMKQLLKVCGNDLAGRRDQVLRHIG